MNARPPRTRLLLASSIALLSGAAALAHQLLWTRRLVDILGASEGTFARVVGTFFLGLAVGGWISSRALGRISRLWLWLAAAEALVGILALPLASAASLGGWLAFHGWLTPITQWLLPLILIFPASLVMGCVTPLLIHGLAEGPAFRSGQAVWVYGANTLGGILGIAAVTLVALPTWGLTTTAFLTICINVVGALLAMAAQGWQSGRSSLLTTSPRTFSALSIHPRWLLGLSFASGYLIMGQEVLFQHQFAQVTINSFFSSATVLAFVLLGLAGAAWLSILLVQGRMEHLASRLGWVLAGSGLACLLEPFVFLGLRPNLAILPYELAPVPYFLAVSGLGLLTITPLLLTGGMVFPLCLRATLDSGAGQTSWLVGRLLAINGLGGWLGAELTERATGPWLGIWGGTVSVGCLYLIGALAYVRSRSPGGLTQRHRLLIAGTFLLACGALAATRGLPQVSRKPGEELVDLKVGREGVVATVSLATDDWRMIFNNSYTLGGSKAQFNQERQAHLPLLLHGQPTSVALLGLATGSTAAGATLHPQLRFIHAAELSPLVAGFAQSHFAPFNRQALADPRLRIVRDDARWLVAANPDHYDVVVGDLFLPWRSGEGRLFTLEHFQAVRRSLKPDGLFCQWLPLFQLTRAQFDTILHTFSQVFPDLFLVRGDFYTELPIVGLVGGRPLAKVDWDLIRQACGRLRANPSVQDPLVRHAEGVAMCILGPPSPNRDAPVNTLANAWLEWDAGRNILGLQSPWWVGIPCAEYLREVFKAGHSLIPPSLQTAHDAGQFFLTLEIAAKLKLPVLPDLRSQVGTRMPEPLTQDVHADWRQWPMRIKPRLPDR